jgi:hypothetical protein
VNAGEGEVLEASGSDATPKACPYPTDNGCAAANKHGSFQNPSLLISAQQSGQTSLLPKHPMTFNIPAVDYPVGPDKTLSPRDPRTINDGVCVYNGTGANTPPNDFVGCTASGVVTETLNNYDFCGTKIGKAILRLYAGGTPSIGSRLILTNNYFCLFPSTGIYSRLDNYSLAWGGGNGRNWSIIYRNNQCDGSAADANSGFCIRDDADAAGTSIDIRYNAFTNQGVGRISGGFTNMTYTQKYNFIQGLNDLATTNHGELMLRNCTGARHNCTSFDNYEGNFIIWNRPHSPGLNNATIFPGDGSSDGVTLTSMTFLNNIIVTNKNGSTTVIDDALFNARLATMGTVTMSGNWVDATGANNCSISGVKSGGSTVTASASGNTLNVTDLSSSFNNFPIEPGWLILHSGFTTASITARGTGVGKTGTYTFGGSPQTLGSDSNWTLVPGYIGTPDLSNNWNLNDPSHTGMPRAMNISGPQMTEATCVN